MSAPIPINLAVEDALSESLLRALISQSKREYAIGTCYGKQGYGYLKKTIIGFNNAAKQTPFFILTDLDTTACPPKLISDWLPQPKHHNLVFRVAVQEVESWILGHRDAFARFLGVKTSEIPDQVDTIADPKQFLIRLARKSPKMDLRKDIVPPKGSLREQGPNYNGRLAEFVRKYWKFGIGQRHSESLRRAASEIARFQPIWKN